MTADASDAPDLTTIPIRVLVVDDDESHAQAVAESLSRINCECQVASSGERGSGLSTSGSWDVIVTDLRMGDIDGLEILRLAKEELPDFGAGGGRVGTTHWTLGGGPSAGRCGPP